MIVIMKKTNLLKRFTEWWYGTFDYTDNVYTSKPLQASAHCYGQDNSKGKWALKKTEIMI